MINAYRVLLTRARQRIAICVVRVFERSGGGGAVQRLAIVFFYLSALSNSNFLYICRSAFEVV